MAACFSFQKECDAAGIKPIFGYSLLVEAEDVKFSQIDKLGIMLKGYSMAYILEYVEFELSFYIVIIEIVTKLEHDI